MIRIIFGVFIFLSVVGCQSNPTTISQEINSPKMAQELKKLIKPGTVIFDIRPTFDFNLHRLAGSISLPPDDFKVSADSMSAARRLSLWGVNPDTPVLIVGTNLESITHLAWEMAQVGIKNIETYSLEKLRTLNTFPEQARTNVTIWTPSENYQNLNSNDLKNLSNKGFEKFKNSLVLQVGDSVIPDKFKSLPRIKWTDNYEFNSSFFLVVPQKFSDTRVLNSSLILVDSSKSAHQRAFVTFKSGAKKLTLIK